METTTTETANLPAVRMEAGLPMVIRQIPEQQLVNVAKFTEAQKDQIRQMAATTDLTDTNTVLTFGAASQRKLTGVLDQLLAGVTTAETGIAGEITIELARGIKRLNLRRMMLDAEGKDWMALTFGSLPIFGPYVSALRHFFLMRAEILKYLDEIVAKAEKQKYKILENNAKLDSLVDATEENVRALELNIAAGEMALIDAHEAFGKRRARLLETPAEKRDALESARLRDFAEQIAGFETRLLRMKIALADGIIQIPQIRLTQQAGRIEVQNIMDSLLFDIPRLKSALLRITSIHEIRNANKASLARRETMREVAMVGAEALKEAYTESKATQGQGAEDVAMLAQVANKLMETIEQGARIDADNKAKRAEAAAQIAKIKTEFVEALEKADASLLPKAA